MLCHANFGFTDGFMMIILLLIRLGAFYRAQVCYCPYLQIHFGQPPYNVRSTMYPLLITLRVKARARYIDFLNVCLHCQIHPFSRGFTACAWIE